MENKVRTEKLTRRQLYDEIWQISVAGVARKYDLVYTRLMAVCKSEAIPYPSSGYWTKKNMGKDVSGEVVSLTGDENKVIPLSSLRSPVSRIPKTKQDIKKTEPKKETSVLSTEQETSVEPQCTEKQQIIIAPARNEAEEHEELLEQDYLLFLDADERKREKEITLLLEKLGSYKTMLENINYSANSFTYNLLDAAYTRLSKEHDIFMDSFINLVIFGKRKTNDCDFRHEDLALRIERYRIEACLSQLELANRIGDSLSGYKKMITGKTKGISAIGWIKVESVLKKVSIMTAGFDRKIDQIALAIDDSIEDYEFKEVVFLLFDAMNSEFELPQVYIDSIVDRIRGIREE